MRLRLVAFLLAPIRPLFSPFSFLHLITVQQLQEEGSDPLVPKQLLQDLMEGRMLPLRPGSA